MAGDWIKMRMNLPTHPKVVRMASALQADRLRILGGLLSAWCLFDEHSIDGHLSGYSFEALDDLIRFPGFSAAMAGVEWLEASEIGLQMVRFEEHNGQSAKRRAQDADRKRNDRNSSASDADIKPTKSGPEKRREESSSLRSEDSAFDEAWGAYPKRPGASKADSRKTWAARRKAGVTAEELLSGVRRYAAFVLACQTEPQFIKQPATFFGPGAHYLADWAITPASNRPPQGAGKFAAAAAGIFSTPEKQGDVIDV